MFFGLETISDMELGYFSLRDLEEVEFGGRRITSETCFGLRAPCRRLGTTTALYALVIDQANDQFDEDRIMDIQEILRRRTDLSTFLVHLTKANGDKEAGADCLESILTAGRIEARSMFGHAVKALEKATLEYAGQKCASALPKLMEHIHLLFTGTIKGRNVKFEPYGVAITKRIGRKERSQSCLVH